MTRTSSSPNCLSLRDNPAGRGLILVSLALLALGVVMVHSALASVKEPGAWYTRADIRHTVFAAVAVLTMIALWRVDYRVLGAGRSVPIVPSVLLAAALVTGVLVFVPGIGHSVGGQARWLRIGPAQYAIGFQPSEFIKIMLVVFLAAWLAREGTHKRSFWRTFLPASLLILVCAAVVMTEDFGTAIIIVLTSGATLLLAGVPWYYLASLIPPGVAAFYVLVLHTPHRLQRITAWMNPWSLSNPSTYQPRQALLAIMTGGWWGKGLGCGMQKLGYLPEDSTDFIFSVYCEEFGFVGAVLLAGLFLLWIWQARKVAALASDDLGRLLAGSLGFLVASQAVLHVAVDTGAAPPTGASLPFISAGGTALVLLAAAVAMMVSVTAHRAHA